MNQGTQTKGPETTGAGAQVAGILAALALGATAVGGGGCAFDESLDTLEFRTTFGCSQCTWGGGGNSAHVNLHPIHSLDLGGNQANSGGVRLVNVESPGGIGYQLRTLGDELIAVDPEGDVVAMPSAMIGWKINLESAGETLQATILGYDPGIATWGTLKKQTISGYALGYVDPDTGRMKSVCPDLLGQANAIALTVIAGETYDELTRTPIAAPGWISLACFGNAAAKMKLMSYHPLGNVDGLGTVATPAEREATLRMFTADYCGDGTNFTEDNTPLFWKNVYGTQIPPKIMDDAHLEALWDQHGALCLSKPRLATHAEVADHCTLPVCTQVMIDAANYEWITWRDH